MKTEPKTEPIAVAPSWRVLWWDAVGRRHILQENVGVNHPTPQAAAAAAMAYGIGGFRIVDEMGNRAEL